MSSQSLAYHVRTFTGSAWRTIGTFFKADFRAPEVLRGKYIFLRMVRSDRDLYMQSRKSNGFSTAVFEQVKLDGAVYMVTHSKESGRMVIGHVSAYVIEGNFSQGLQTHASMDNCHVLNNVAKLNYPTAIATKTVQDEQPSDDDVLPVAVQPVLLARTEKRKELRQRCGCLYLDGQIEKPCLDHAEIWKTVIAQKRSINQQSLGR
jgi:hypothetical protein